MDIHYHKRIKEIKDLLVKQKQSESSLLLNSYTFITANLTNFLPSIDQDEHPRLFQQVRFHQMLSALDTEYFDGDFPLPIDGWETIRKQVAEDRMLLCTYHFGAFQLINYVLLRERLPFTLLVGSQTQKMWERRYPRLLKSLEQASSEGLFELLDISKGASLRKLYSAKASRRKILIYIDGLEGLQGVAAENLACVHFLGQAICVPKGAAQLSRKLNMPLLPILSLRAEDRISFIAGKAIFPCADMPKDLYCRLVMQYLYSFLATYLMHWPEQWTNWPHLHRYLQMGSLLKGAVLLDAKEENLASALGVYSVDQKYFLLQKKDYASFEINKAAYEKLRADPQFSGRLQTATEDHSRFTNSR